MLAHRVLLDGPPRFDPNGLTLDPAQLSEAVPEHFDALPLFWIVLSQDTQPPDHPHAIPGLRSCAKRPRERPANQPDATPPRGMSGKEHSEGRRGSVHATAPVAAGTP